MSLPDYTDVQTPQVLDIPFTVSDLRKGVVKASVEPNNDPEHHGQILNITDLNMQVPDFIGYPVCQATVRSTGADGYGALYGWVQLVKATYSDDKWEMDPIPVTRELNTPFVWFGPEPTLFDAPSRSVRQQIDWTCHSFLTYLDNWEASKEVIPILGIEWGFWIKDEIVHVKPLKEVGLDAWDEHLDLLRSQHHGWEFRSHEDKS